jgi:vacuolar-type H+-ATPase subunit D/Vma8
MKFRFTNITPFLERRRNELADELQAHAVECHEIAERHSDLIKEQYEALAQQSLILAAQRIRTV